MLSRRPVVATLEVSEDMQVEGVSKGKGEVKGENVAPVLVSFDAQAVHNHNIPYSDFVYSPFKLVKTDQTN